MWENALLLCKHSINNVTNLHNFEATGISINYYNSPRTVSVKVLRRFPGFALRISYCA